MRAGLRTPLCGRLFTMLISLAAAALLTGCAAPSPDSALAVSTILHQQADDWNRGDIESFMSHYWRSDALTFSAAGVTQRGWEATMARYRSRYPTPEAMGRLTFSDLQIEPLAPDAVLVLGRYAVHRQDEQLEGNFTLIFRQIAGRWVIVHDHTSSKPPDTANSAPEELRH
jgi:beta-aspartyl-peptidase (threonine type)